jgi:hypothetical protein
MKYAVEMGSGAMIYIPSFIKVGSAIQMLIRRDSQTHRQHGERISLLSPFQNKESRLKTDSYPRLLLGIGKRYRQANKKVKLSLCLIN